MRFTTLALLAAGIALCTPPGIAAAKTKVAPSFFPQCPKGQLLMVRIMKVTGTREGLSRAVEDNNRWYRDHGFTRQNPHIEATVIDHDPITNSFNPSSVSVATVQLDSTLIPASEKDEKWDRFVREYQANAGMDREILLCLSAALK